MPKLEDPQRELFCQEIVNGATKAQAHERAGYLSANNRRKTAYKLYTTKWCQDRLAELRDEALRESKRTGSLTKKAVLGKLEFLYEKVTEEVPVLDRRGNPTGVTKLSDATAAVKLLNMMGLEAGMFNPEKKTRHGQLDPVESMNPAELMKFVENKLKALSPSALRKLGFVPRNDTEQLTAGSGEDAEESGDSSARPVRTLQ